MNREGYKITWVILLLYTLIAGHDADAEPAGDTTAKTNHWSVGGYLKDLQSIQFTDINKQWTLDNLVHNRFDIHWYPSQNWKVRVGVRNRIYYGDSTSIYQIATSLQDGNGYFDLSKNVANGQSYVINTTLDRASIDYTKGKWQITLGRQRVNWSMNLVWNPNDIFNTYSYFDFDYEERPGTDAARVQYYISSTSAAEVAFKPGKNEGDGIIGGMYRFNIGGYDIQLLAGSMGKDYVLGGGWSGVIEKAGFNGEVTAFEPHNDIRLSRVIVAASLGANYTFPSSLYLHGAYLLNSTGLLKTDSLLPNTVLNNVTAKSLSPARHSIFGEVAYQFTPLFRTDIGGIADPGDGSFFIGPFLTFSLSNNIEMLFAGQLFFGNRNSIYGNYGQIYFLRLKWSF